jgi:hypothetical protein
MSPHVGALPTGRSATDRSDMVMRQAGCAGRYRDRRDRRRRPMRLALRDGVVTLADRGSTWTDSRRRPPRVDVNGFEAPASVARRSRTVDAHRAAPALFNMLASFSVTFGITRGITSYIRDHGGLGPIQNVIVGKRHIHHFIPGGLIALSAGGVAIGMKGQDLDKYFALPFGIGGGEPGIGL